MAVHLLWPCRLLEERGSRSWPLAIRLGQASNDECCRSVLSPVSSTADKLLPDEKMSEA